MTLKRSFLLASFLFLTLLTLPVWAQHRQVLPTSVSAPTGARVIDHLNSSQRLRLALTLPLRNQEALQTLVDQLYDPASPKYHQFLTVEQFTEQFGPSTDDYERVIAFTASHGLAVANKAPNRLVLDVTGTVTQIEQAFQVTMQVYQHPTEHRTYYAPDVEPSVEPGIPIQGVSGLNNFSPPRPMSLRHAAPGPHPNQTGSGPGGQFLGSDMRAAYAPGVTLAGTGQAVGLFEFGPYNLSDVQSYFSTISQPLNVPIVNVLLDGVNGICGAGCDDGEEAIDIQQSISMAPGLSVVIVYEGTDDTDIFNQMATDNIAKQLSCSFGWLPADPASDEPIFFEFAVQGQNLLVASGDGGAYTPPGCTTNCNIIFYPADDPHITAAGGTDLTTNGPGGTWQSEIGWVGSGGGFSTNGFSIPAYQVPVITSLNQGSTTLRNIPDLAAEANTDNYYCANGSCQGGVGGTSLAGPRWAGFLALANQQANGHAIGFLNPAIYTIGQRPNYDNDFHDIVVGNNFNSESPDLFSDVVGYDLVTGWGSPNGQSLLNTLGPSPTGPNFALAASPNILHVTQGSTATSTISLTSIGGFTGVVDLRVTVLGQPAGVTASLSVSSLTGSGTSTLTVATTDSTPGGNLPIVVTGTSGGVTQTAYLTLALPGFSLTPTPSNVFLNQYATATSTITVTPVNGFTGHVTLSLSGLPRGVAATIRPGGTGSSTLVFVATQFAATGFATVAVTGTSGDLTQTAFITLAVSAATGPGSGVGLVVDLSPAYNVSGIYTDGTTYTTGGLDGDGYSYSANLLTPTRDFDGIEFHFGPANRPDAVSGTGQPIALPAGKFVSMRMLATGVNGDQTQQTITVTYTDGTTSQYTLNFSDWFTPQDYPAELEGVAMPYRDVSDGTMDNRTFNLYGYTFDLKSAKRVQSFTLPDNRNLVVLAVTLTAP
jgi:subtilase family serine protease